MNIDFLSEQSKYQIQLLLSNNDYEGCKRLIMDLKRNLHILYADIEKSEKDYLNTKQLNLF